MDKVFFLVNISFYLVLDDNHELLLYLQTGMGILSFIVVLLGSCT